MTDRIILFCLALCTILCLDFICPVYAQSSDRHERQTKQQQIATQRIIGSHNKLVKAYLGVDKNFMHNKRISTIIKRLGKTAKFRNKKIIPIVLNSPQINAFSLSSDAKRAYIYATKGLLNFIKNDNELAFILAHEMAHITLKDFKQRTDKQQIDVELKADKLGVKYMTLAGFDKKFAISFIKRLNVKQNNQIGENTHIYPSNQLRLKQLYKLQ